MRGVTDGPCTQTFTNPHIGFGGETDSRYCATDRVFSDYMVRTCRSDPTIWELKRPALLPTASFVGVGIVLLVLCRRWTFKLGSGWKRGK